MTANKGAEERLIQIIGQMKPDQELRFIYRAIQYIPLKKVFHTKDYDLLNEAIDVLSSAISHKVNNYQYETYLSLVANKCEQIYNKSKTTPHLISDTQKLEATAAAADAIYISLELVYHITNNKQCPMNSMHIINNIEKCMGNTVNNKNENTSFLEKALKDAQKILKENIGQKQYQPQREVTKIIQFPKS